LRKSILAKRSFVDSGRDDLSNLTWASRINHYNFTGIPTPIYLF
jgi:hypothetical protein